MIAAASLLILLLSLLWLDWANTLPAVAQSNKPRIPYAVTLNASSITTDTPYVLIDMSNVASYPHTLTPTAIVLRGVYVEAVAAGEQVFHIGVVTENDATDGSATWLFSAETTTGTLREFYGLPEQGLNLQVSSGALVNVLSSYSQTNSANWQNDTTRLAPLGSGSAPGVGDLVLFVDWTSGSVDFNISALYDTE